MVIIILRVLADAGLLSKDNVAQLQQKGYEYILGAKIKTESVQIKEKIFQLDLKNGTTTVIDKDEHTRLIISYSDARARKDAYNRLRGIEKLNKQIQSGKLSKTQINNRGNNKFLEMEGSIHIQLNQDKIEADENKRIPNQYKS
ncbi:MAG: hypothetical protein M9958_09685 [Chitinophagales bacterium]|nr:hypothetical protein [Chitinophagales bacterium]